MLRLPDACGKNYSGGASLNKDRRFRFLQVGIVPFLLTN